MNGDRHILNAEQFSEKKNEIRSLVDELPKVILLLGH